MEHLKIQETIVPATDLVRGPLDFLIQGLDCQDIVSKIEASEYDLVQT